MTFSLVARCPDSGMFGTVVTSSSICVASRCSFVRPAVGAAQSQNITDPELGPRLLDLCEQGLSAQEAMAQVVKETEKVQWRQLGVVDKNGGTACFSGSETLGIHAMAEGKDCVAMGNMLANTEIPAAMVAAFEQAVGTLAERLLMGIEAGLAAGGEAGPIHSAGLLVATADMSWPVVNLRVDWEDEPDYAIAKLRSVWSNYLPQMQAYIVRSVTPENSDPYGVPGDPA
ncbi:DUF1028 domain-containing protein [Dasania sp. GY-MA-18]|uniref:DUF1028 domain-containing protein n=1 Tax=Dasania phycosphaerae TaxID=2950436 RepID=A0A9J6RM39_9GAMM|nr:MULTISPECIES: DUF1028 domain-containing protein [Dasania]MCR8923155.1 DUF1028 domain-containing protein [Dasania sp. GY-MA-18]MCZ0865587.1 DUF1028 domain-containing protein [Dasania phycosphaerae]MCZ0869312.1 DUF1028 domain-containing protein [Dasania phycosphaerae]